MIGRMEIREVLGMLGTLAALSVAGSAVQMVDAEIVEVRESPTVEQPAAVEVPEAPAKIVVRPPVVITPMVAPPAAAPGLDTDEVRLNQPDVQLPPLRCPPLAEGGVRGPFKHCRERFV